MYEVVYFQKTVKLAAFTEPSSRSSVAFAAEGAKFYY